MLTQIIGIFGAALILIAFFINQTNRWRNDSLAYDGVNLVGAVLLSINAILIGSIAFLALNIVWAIVALKDIITKLTNQ